MDVEILQNSMTILLMKVKIYVAFYEGWNFNSGNYLFTTDTK